MDCQISPIPEQICLSFLSLRFHYFLPFSIWSDELSKHVFAEQKTPSQCSMERFSQEPNLGFDEQRRWSQTAHAEFSRYSWRFTNRFHLAEISFKIFLFKLRLHHCHLSVSTPSSAPSCCLPALSLLLTFATLPYPTPLLLLPAPPAVRAGAQPGSLGAVYQLRICQQQVLNPSWAGVPCHQGVPLLAEEPQCHPEPAALSPPARPCSTRSSARITVCASQRSACPTRCLWFAVGARLLLLPG